MMSNIPVHPQEGSVGPAEENQRRTWIQTLTQEQLLEVDALVRHKWQLQRTTSPAWMHGFLPAQPPAEFWSAEYYICMAEFIEKSKKRKEVAPVLDASSRGAAESMLPRARIPEGQAESSLRGAADSMPLRTRISEGQASTKVEPETAGVVYGMDAIMNGTAYAEDTTEPYDDAQVCFIGSLSLRGRLRSDHEFTTRASWCMGIPARGNYLRMMS